MPTYDYECKNCSYRFEVFQKMSDPPIELCPKCGQGVRRIIGTGAGIIFKGSGFYATDYRKKEDKKNERGKLGTCSGFSSTPECDKKKD